MSLEFPKRECGSLSQLCQVAVVKLLHKKALQVINSFYITFITIQNHGTVTNNFGLKSHF